MQPNKLHHLNSALPGALRRKHMQSISTHYIILVNLVVATAWMTPSCVQRRARNKPVRLVAAASENASLEKQHISRLVLNMGSGGHRRMSKQTICIHLQVFTSRFMIEAVKLKIILGQLRNTATYSTNRGEDFQTSQ